MLEHSKLYYFFFADFCRITINILILIGFILFVILLHKAFSKKKSHFNLLFVVMINIIVCALLSIIGYIFNWKIIDNNGGEKKRILLFGNRDDFLCRIQSIFLNYFQTVRESLLTSLTIIVFINYKAHNTEKIQFKILIFSFCYGIPVISNIICFIFDGFGDNDLFCFTKDKGFGKAFGIIHYLYLLTLLITNLALVLSIIIMDYRQGKEYEDWLIDDEKASKCRIINPSLKKIIGYPIAQIVALIFPSIYRIGNKVGTSTNWAKIAATGNSFSVILYTIIYFYSNKQVLNEEIQDNEANEANRELSSAI